MPEKAAPYTAYNTALLPRSRELRRKMTVTERHLWYDFLRDYPIKFYKQRSVDNFILDFYCDCAKLAIEIDGGQHYLDDIKDYDAMRTAILTGYGIEVIRFSNLDVSKSFGSVCRAIELKINERLTLAAIRENSAQCDDID